MQPITCDPTALLSIPIPPISHHPKCKHKTSFWYKDNRYNVYCFQIHLLTKSLMHKFTLCINIINNESITIHNVPITEWVVSLCSIALDALSDSGHHWANQPMNPVHCNGLSLLKCDLLKLFQCGVVLHLPINSLLQLIPQMFDWVKVQWTGRPLHDCNSILCQMIHHSSCCVGSCIILLMNKVLSQLLHKVVHNGGLESQQYTTEHVSCHWFWPAVFFLYTYSCPHYNAAPSICRLLLDTTNAMIGTLWMVINDVVTQDELIC